MSDTGYKGMQDPASGASEFNALSFLMTRVLNRANTSTLVQIKAVTNSGGLSPVGFVDVQPLVMQIGGDGKTEPHGVIYNIPYFRLQGGTDAVIIDPKINDIGIAVFADHDISSVKASVQAAPPGSMRRFDMADGMFLGGFLNGVPTQYVQFSTAGINVVSPTKITMTAPDVEVVASNSFKVTSPTSTLTGDLITLGAATITKILTYLAGLAGTGTAKSNGVNVGSDHAHGNVQNGPGITNGPQ